MYNDFRPDDNAYDRALTGQVLARQELVAVLQHLPYMALIVTAKRDTVFANQAALDTLGLRNLTESLARRPGELFHCANTDNLRENCGSTEGCRHCLTASTIAEALESGEKVTRETRLVTRRNEQLGALDFKVTAAPLALNGSDLAMVFLEDISALKRREHLESTFLHDLANSVGCLQMLAELHNEDPARVCPAELLRQVAFLSDEVRAQQILVEAEHGQLHKTIQCVQVSQLLDDTLDGISAFREKLGVTISVKQPEFPVYIATDLLLARRVLLNAVKNALEASMPGDQVTITVTGCRPQAVITIWNPGAMSASTQHQVFQRSFSTKGKGRGLGTYSMRLLQENYLGGTVSFTSDPVAGTSFTFTFPPMTST